MKTIIRQWLCEHKKTSWIGSKKTYIESLSTSEPKLERAIEWFMCDDCKKFIKLDTGRLLIKENKNNGKENI